MFSYYFISSLLCWPHPTFSTLSPFVTHIVFCFFPSSDWCENIGRYKRSDMLDINLILSHHSPTPSDCKLSYPKNQLKLWRFLGGSWNKVNRKGLYQQFTAFLHGMNIEGTTLEKCPVEYIYINKPSVACSRLFNFARRTRRSPYLTNQQLHFITSGQTFVRRSVRPIYNHRVVEPSVSV